MKAETKGNSTLLVLAGNTCPALLGYVSALHMLWMTLNALQMLTSELKISFKGQVNLHIQNLLAVQLQTPQ